MMATLAMEKGYDFTRDLTSDLLATIMLVLAEDARDFIQKAVPLLDVKKSDCWSKYVSIKVELKG